LSSCLVLSCLVLSCLVLSCLVLSCLVLSCLVLSCLVLPCLALSCREVRKCLSNEFFSLVVEEEGYQIFKSGGRLLHVWVKLSLTRFSVLSRAVALLRRGDLEAFDGRPTPPKGPQPQGSASLELRLTESCRDWCKHLAGDDGDKILPLRIEPGMVTCMCRARVFMAVDKLQSC